MTSSLSLALLLSLAGLAGQPAAPVAPTVPAAPKVPVVKAAPVAPPAPAAPHAPATPAAPVHPANSPFVFDTTSHDFGKIADTKPVTFDFTFKNITDKVVNIQNATGSCGCTVPSWEKQIQPGASSKITTTFNPTGRNGHEVKTITLYLDTPTTPQLQLQISADVQKRISVEPAQVYMGEVPFTTSQNKIFSVTGRAENFDIVEAQVHGNGFKLERIGSEKVDVGGESLSRVSYKVIADSSIPIGRAQASVVMTTTDPQNPTVAVSVIADVIGQLRINPPQFGVRMTAADEPFASEIAIDSRDGKPFTILGISFEPAAGVAATVDLKPVLDVSRRDPGSKAAYRVRLAGTTPATANDLRGIIKVQTDVKDQEELTIQVTGFQMGGAPAGGPVIKPAPSPLKTAPVAPPSPTTAPAPAAIVPGAPALAPAPSPAPVPVDAGKPK